jgi:hypothetical protein
VGAAWRQDPRRPGRGRVRAPGSIPDEMIFLAWVSGAAKGLTVDGLKFDLEDRPAMVPLYEAIPQPARRKAYAEPA